MQLVEAWQRSDKMVTEISPPLKRCLVSIPLKYFHRSKVESIHIEGVSCIFNPSKYSVI